MSARSEIVQREAELVRRQKHLLRKNNMKICTGCKEALPYSAFSSGNAAHRLKSYCKVCDAASRKKTYHNVRNALLDVIGHACRICGATESIDIDHIRSDGAVDRKVFATCQVMWKYYTRNPDLAKERLQPLCRQCHIEKCNIEKRTGGGPRPGMSNDAIQRERDTIEGRRQKILDEIAAKKRGAGQQEIVP